MSKSLTIIQKGDLFKNLHNNINLYWWCEVPGDDKNAVSIQSIVESNAEKYRSDYISWVNTVSESFLKGRYSDVFNVSNPHLSYFYLTRFFEKNNYEKSPQIRDVIGLLALSDYMNKNSFNDLVLLSRVSRLNNFFEQIAGMHGCTLVKSERNDKISYLFFEIKSWGQLFLGALKGIIWLCANLAENFNKNKLTREMFKENSAEVTFVSYLTTSRNDSYYRSKEQFWGKLAQKFDITKLKANWLFLYEKNGSFNSLQRFRKYVASMNESNASNGNHIDLFSFFDWHCFFATLSNWLRLASSGQVLLSQINEHPLRGLSLGSLFRKEVCEDFYTIRCAKELANIFLFESYFLNVTKQSSLVFTMENQAWEKSLLLTAKNAEVGQSIGFVHTISRFWDLRYGGYESSSTKNFSSLFPSKVAVTNTNDAQILTAAFKDSAVEMVDVEPLRFESRTNKAAGLSGQVKRVLIFTDYSNQTTKLFLRMFDEALGISKSAFDFTIKFHPSFEPSLTQYGNFKPSVTNAPLDELIPKADLIVSAPSTSLLIVVASMGIPLLIMNDTTDLDFCPLRGFPNVLRFSNANELSQILDRPSIFDQKAKIDFEFNPDAGNLRLWSQLIPPLGVALERDDQD